MRVHKAKNTNITTTYTIQDEDTGTTTAVKKSLVVKKTYKHLFQCFQKQEKYLVSLCVGSVKESFHLLLCTSFSQSFQYYTILFYINIQNRKTENVDANNAYIFLS